MPTVSFINPVDQPTGNKRLLEELKRCLGDPDFKTFGFSVAFAKTGPLLRLAPILGTWKAAKKDVFAIMGIDHKGTSVQALEFALDNFNEVYVTKYPWRTFHPKIYWFTGSKKGCIFVGSNNLTVGGTETNFESCIRLDYDLSIEQTGFDQALEGWVSLLPANCPATFRLSKEILDTLNADGKLADENAKPSEDDEAETPPVASRVAREKDPALRLAVKPASAIPKTVMAAAPAKSLKETAPKAAKKTGGVSVSGFAIQIKPHHNGEIFLSVTAALQNPDFFGWPFRGVSTPKKGDNKGYPQRTPDPVVNITVYGSKSDPLLTLSNYKLNTVYYKKKTEIRITASPLVDVVPEYSVMIMTKSTQPGIDYEIIVHTPDSHEYGQWVSACNQTMPSGGRTPRKYGWF
mgnify:FL=1